MYVDMDNLATKPSSWYDGSVDALSDQQTHEIFTNICAGYYQFFLTKSIGKYHFSTIFTVSMYHQILCITGVGVEII